jgi:hypothetical protein
MTDPTLGYFRPAAAATRAPASVTVIAWTGIALCSLILLSKFSGLTASPSASPGEFLGVRNGTTAAYLGFVFGFLLRWTFYILMLVSCVGLLQSRPAARLLCVVCAYAWIVLTILEIVFLIWAISAAQTVGPPRGLAPSGLTDTSVTTAILFSIAVACAIGVAFPFGLLIILRRPAAVQHFRRRPGPPASPPPPGSLEKTAAWAALLLGCVLILGESALFLSWILGNFTGPRGQSRFVIAEYALAAIPETGAPMALLHIVAWVALVVAAVLAIRRRPASRALMTIACLALIILGTARPATRNDLTRFASPVSPTENPRAWFIRRSRPIGVALREAFPWALLLLIFIRPPPAPDQDTPADAEIIL